MEKLGDRYVDVLDTYRQIVGGHVIAQSGSIVEYEGDGILAAFADPAAAVRAAVACQLDMGSATWPGEHGVKARIGIHTGAVQQVGSSYIGLELHRAFRIASAANGGQILIGAATTGLVEPVLSSEGWALVDLGTFALKGLSHTEALHQLRADGLETTFGAVNASSLGVANLPTELNSMVGRERETMAVVEMLARPDVRVITLTGPGGTGKTRLAAEVARAVAHNYPDGAFFVGLAEVTDASGLVREIALGLGLPLERGRMEAVLSEYLTSKRLLLILDNFEQLVDLGPDGAALLERWPGVQALVTSRIALRIRGEHEYRVLPLQNPSDDRLATIEQSEAVKLFVDRARAVRTDFELTDENGPTIAALCRTLDGLPLALELAAARVKLLPPRVLLDRLERRLDTLVGGPADAPDRHRTLRAAIQWSVEMLSPAERRLFARLAVFKGDFTAEAAEEVCGEGLGDVLSLIESLVNKSLLQAATDEESLPRLRMLATIGEYALDELEANGEIGHLRSRQVDYMRGWGSRLAPRLRGAEQEAALDEGDREYPNVRAVGDWLLANNREIDLAHLLIDIWPHLWLRGLSGAVQDWSHHLSASVNLPAREQGWVLVLAGGTSVEAGEYEQAYARTDQALGCFETVDEPVGAAWARMIRSAVLPASVLGTQVEESIRSAAEAVELFRSVGDSWGQAYAYSFLGTFELFFGRLDTGHTHLELGLDLARELQNVALLGQAHTLLSFSYSLGGDFERARSEMRNTLAIFESNYLLSGLAFAVQGLAGLLLAEGQVVKAATALGSAESVWRAAQLRPHPAAQISLDMLASVTESAPELQAARLAGASIGPSGAIDLAMSLLEDP